MVGLGKLFNRKKKIEEEVLCLVELRIIVLWKV